MIGPALLLLAQTATPPVAVPDDIVVIGSRAEDALAACLERNCPPAQEVEASLQASVEQFVAGRYAVARRTLQTAIKRNRDHAAELPGPVSSLYATLATVAEHEGDTRLWTASARNNLTILRKYVGSDNRATLTEQISFGDTLLGMNQPQAADSTYATVQRVAIERNYSMLAAAATFRRALVAFAGREYKVAQRFADESVRLAGSDARLMGELRDTLNARIAIQKGDEGAIDALVARLRQSTDRQPRLLYSKPVSELEAIGDGIRQDPWHDSEIRYADVGYWIRPDGRTSGVEILRDRGLGQWRPGILKQVGERRYVPLDVAGGHPGLYRIDRFTVRGTIGTPIGSRIERRIGRLTVHVIDLTETEALSDVHKQRVAEGAAPETT